MILPKPWGPETKIGLVYSWDNARRRAVDPGLYDKLPAYYSALRYSHWNMAMLPSDRIVESGVPAGIEVVVAAGLTHVEHGLSSGLRRFVENGGTLILGECDFTQDVHEQALPTGSSLVAALRSEREIGDVMHIPVDKATETLFPGPLSAGSLEYLAVKRDMQTVIQDDRSRPVVVRMPLGQGVIYFQGADAYGYSLAKLMHAILTHADADKAANAWLSARITEGNGQLAPNILLSRRSYADRHVILLHNCDQYQRTVRVGVPGLAGAWKVRDALRNAAADAMTAEQIRSTGIEVQLDPAGPAVILLERNP